MMMHTEPAESLYESFIEQEPEKDKALSHYENQMAPMIPAHGINFHPFDSMPIDRHNTVYMICFLYGFA